MRFEKKVLHENLTFVALVDDDERVIAAGVFNQQEDAETAIGFCQAMIFNAGLGVPINAMKDSDIPPTPPKHDELPRLSDVITKLTDHARQLKSEMKQ